MPQLIKKILGPKSNGPTEEQKKAYEMYAREHNRKKRRTSPLFNAGENLMEGLESFGKGLIGFDDAPSGENISGSNAFGQLAGVILPFDKGRKILKSKQFLNKPKEINLSNFIITDKMVKDLMAKGISEEQALNQLKRVAPPGSFDSDFFTNTDKFFSSEKTLNKLDKINSPINITGNQDYTSRLSSNKKFDPTGGTPDKFVKTNIDPRWVEVENDARILGINPNEFDNIEDLEWAVTRKVAQDTVRTGKNPLLKR